MPSAEGTARSGRGGWIAVGLGVVLVVAAGITIVRSQPDGLGFAEVQTEGQLEATAAKRAGTTCAGWPLELTPTGRPTDVAGSVALWGDRDALRVANATDAEVVVDIVAVDGSLRSVSGATSVADDHLRATLAPGGEAAFTATCATQALGLATTPSDVGFATGRGRAPSPLTIEKQRAG